MISVVSILICDSLSSRLPDELCDDVPLPPEGLLDDAASVFNLPALYRTQLPLPVLIHQDGPSGYHLLS